MSQDLRTSADADRLRRESDVARVARRIRYHRITTGRDVPAGDGNTAGNNNAVSSPLTINNERCAGPRIVRVDRDGVVTTARVDRQRIGRRCERP